MSDIITDEPKQIEQIVEKSANMNDSEVFQHSDRIESVSSDDNLKKEFLECECENENH